MRTILFGLFAILGAAPSVALAHPALDAVQARIDEVDFAAAEIALEAASAATDFNRDDAIRYYTLQAVVAHAQNKREDLETYAAQLATIDARLTFPGSVPPAVARAYQDAVRAQLGPLALAVDVEDAAGTAALDVHVENDLTAVVQSVRIRARPVGAEEWQQAEGPEIAVTHVPDARIEYVADAVGIGGAVLLSYASSWPELAPPPPPPPQQGAPQQDRGSSGIEPWVFGLSAGVTAVLAGVTVWSGVDTLSLNSAYVDYARGGGATFEEAKRRYGVANDAQLRTNVLIGVSAAAAVATIALAFFTDFDGEPSVTPTVSADATGAMFGLLHHFE